MVAPYWNSVYNELIHKNYPLEQTQSYDKKFTMILFIRFMKWPIYISYIYIYADQAYAFFYWSNELTEIWSGLWKIKRCPKHSMNIIRQLHPFKENYIIFDKALRNAERNLYED